MDHDSSSQPHDNNRNVEMVRKYQKKARKILTTRIKKTFSYLFIIPASLVALYVAFSFGHAAGSHEFDNLVERKTSLISDRQPEKTDELPEADFAPFWDAWVLLESKFVDGANGSSTNDISSDQDRVWGAIKGLAQSYGDPFTTFLPPEEHENFEADISGEFTGVGMEIGNRDEYLTVISPLPGTPADRAGMRPKDIVEKIDGVDSLRMPVEQAVKLIRGPRGEDVVLTVLRRGESEALEITITRDLITIPTIETQQIDDVFLIKLFSFTSKSPSLFANALQEFAESGERNLIVDLRGNPGGYLEAAVDIASRFLDRDVIVVTEQYSEELGEKIRYSKGYNHFNDNLRLVILINGGSASASEIVAGALRDHKKALLIGQKSFGKGSVQELFTLTKDTSLKITIAKWLTPSGGHISENGISPDITTTPHENNSEEDQGTYSLDYAQDSEIQKAIEVLRRSDFKNLFTEVPEDLQQVIDNLEETE